MAEQTRSEYVDGQAGLSSNQLIGEGADATIWHLPRDRTVRKYYLDGELEDRIHRAEEEFSALAKAREALDSIPSVSCPTPYEVDFESGELVMEYCAGEQLDRAIATSRYSDPDQLMALADSITSGISALVEALPLTQLDFSLRNTLLDENRSQLVLIDFTTRAKPVLLPDSATKIECALASFLTSSITFQVRHSTMFDRETGRRLRFIAKSVAKSLQRSHNVSLVRVRKIAWLYYWRQANNRGWKRYLWFHTVGSIIFSALLASVTRTRGVQRT